MARPDKSYLEKQTSRRNAPKKKKALGEGTGESRFAKISFKNYIRQLDEELLDADLEDDLDEDNAE